jgi:hypothetical protein
MRRKAKARKSEERRDAPRVGLDGQYSMRLDLGDGRVPIACRVLDFSITGVRLELPRDIELPSKVKILIGNLSHSARVAWRNDKVVGVDLIDEHHSIY